MDSLEVIQNKGYVSIADADYNRGFSDGEHIKARKMAKAMLLKGFPLGDISLISGLSEEEIKNL